MYEMTQLFWYKIIFMTELLAAESLFVARLKRRSFFVLRLLGAIVLCYGVAFVFPILSYNALYCSFLFLGLFGTTFLMLKFCFAEKCTNLLFCAVAGYTVQHIAFILYDLIVCLFRLSDGNSDIYGAAVGNIYAPFRGPVTALIYLFDFIILYWLAFMLLGRRIKGEGSFKLKSLPMLIILAAFIVIDVVLSAFVTYHAQEMFERTYVVLLDIFNILCCAFALTLLFELPDRKRLQDELDILNRLYKQQEQQYALTKENIELINLKCHDLKHQIRTIGRTGSVGTETIKEMESIISVYDSTVQTGNKALDIILTEKSLLCNRKGIKLTCVADGARLNFMSESDIYVLFGNILDNALEAVAGLEDEKRAIGVNIRLVRGFVSINVYNYFNGKLVFADGLPQTTKADKGFHGFGMKSVRAICEKYGGDLTVGAKDGVFNLNIIFPVGEQDGK